MTEGSTMDYLPNLPQRTRSNNGKKKSKLVDYRTNRAPLSRSNSTIRMKHLNRTLSLPLEDGHSSMPILDASSAMNDSMSSLQSRDADMERSKNRSRRDFRRFRKLERSKSQRFTKDEDFAPKSAAVTEKRSGRPPVSRTLSLMELMQPTIAEGRQTVAPIPRVPVHQDDGEKVEFLLKMSLPKAKALTSRAESRQLLRQRSERTLAGRHERIFAEALSL